MDARHFLEQMVVAFLYFLNLLCPGYSVRALTLLVILVSSFSIARPYATLLEVIFVVVLRKVLALSVQLYEPLKHIDHVSEV